MKKNKRLVLPFFLVSLFGLALSFNSVADPNMNGTCCPQDKASCYVKATPDGPWIENEDKFFQEGIGPCLSS